MPRLTRGVTPGKIDNTSICTHIAPTLICLEKDPVSATDCNSIVYIGVSTTPLKNTTPSLCQAPLP